MPEKKKRQKSRLTVKTCALLLGLCLFFGLSAGIASAEEGGTNQLKNGSFEEGQSFTKAYTQPDQSEVPAWNTTAFEGKIELFRENSSVYVKNDSGAWVTLKPTDEEYAAELNADEESTLYQIVTTTPSSVYEWGLDHGARNGTDIIALVIGPKQNYAPSKPSKAGRDQFMQIVDWLNSDENPTIRAAISSITSGAEPKQYTVFSKKFAANGTFEDNAGNNAFSLTPSTIYTEEWHVWIMASDRAKTETVNPWNSYGSNKEGSAGTGDGSGGIDVDLSKYYLYQVPAGQTETLFGFVSVGYVDSPVSADKAKTYGNFLDNINFKLYHPLYGSTSTHGSAVIGGSDGGTGGEGATTGYKVTVGHDLITYVTNGETLKIQAIVKQADSDAGCEFVGVYYTQPDSGVPKAHFLQRAGNEIDDTGSLTPAEKEGKWVKSLNADGDIVYTYYLTGLDAPIDLRFIFIKSPTITYDPNGGQAYVVDRSYNKDEAANVYSFKPFTGDGVTYTFITPYVSHAAVGPAGKEADWKFMGWLLTGDTVSGIPDSIAQVNEDKLGSLLLPAEHTVACDYAIDGVGGQTNAQYFKIYDSGSLTLTGTQITDTESGEVKGVTWKDGDATKAYANVHKGLTMVAQWRWRQAFIPQVGSGSTYTNSTDGGTVSITSVTDTSDPNYNAAYNTAGGKSYFAEANERVTVKAVANTGFTFQGWYDKDGKLITTSADYTYTVTRNSVTTCYARFSGNVTQTYTRQVWNGTGWADTTNDAIGTLGRYSYTDAAGMPISSTATAGSGYYFAGWVDDAGNAVDAVMLTNGGATISYTTAGDATYYARFRAVAYKVTYDVNDGNGSFSDSGTYYHSTAGTPSTITVAGTAPTREHYTFGGWELVGSSNTFSSSASISVDTYCSNANVVGDVTDGQGEFRLRAKWTPYSYTISYDLGGGALAAEESNPATYNIESAPITLYNPTRVGYTFAGWTGTGISGSAIDVTIPTGSTGERSYTATWTPNTDTAYTVEHYQQNLNDDGYTIVSEDTENLSGTTDTPANATPKTYTGFTENTTHTDRVDSGNIAADGSLVLKLYYDRNTYTVTYTDGVGGEVVFGDQTSSNIRYGAATPAFSGTPTRTGYTFTGWTPGLAATVTDNVTYTATWTPNTDTAYTVEHYKQNLDGTYPTAASETETNYGTTGAPVTATPKTYTGFTENTTHTDRVNSGNIAADGSLVLKLYYTRNTYNITVTVTGGTADAGPSIPLTYGESKTVSFTANPNCVLDSVTVNGAAASLTGEEYTFTDVAEDQTIEVVYKSDVKGAPDADNTEHGDGIPDEYQVFVRYKAGANGSLAGETYQAFDLRQPPSIELKNSVDLTFPTPNAASGYHFTGWTNSDGVTVTGSVMSGFTPGATYTFTAQFTRNYTPPSVDPDPNPNPDPDPVEDPDPPFTVRGLNTVDHVSYIIGVGDNRVDPLGTITRAEIANIFFRLMTDDFRNANWSTVSRFSDVPTNAWYSMAVLNLDKAGIITDSDDGNFRPSDPITRAELAVMAAQFCTITEEVPAASFEDTASDYWAADEIALIEYAGWIEGYNGCFHPDDNLSRAEAITIVNRMLHRGAENENMLEGMTTWVDNSDPAKWYYSAVQEATNSHDYARTNVLLTGEQFHGDKWTALLEATDWAAMEQAWINANS